MKMRNLLSFIALGLIVSLSFSSCTPYQYASTKQNVLNFKEKGEATASFGIEENGKSYSLGYSITDNVAVMSDLKTFRTFSKHSSAQYKIGDYVWDTEVIVYKKFYDHFIPAINLGVGFGQISRNAVDYRMDFRRQYIQPSLGYTNDYFDFALSSRFTKIKYGLDQVNNTLILGDDTFEETYNFGDLGKKEFYFFEPAITVGVGYKFIKLRFQRIYTNKLSTGDLNYQKGNGYLSLNLNYNLNDLFKRNQD